MKNVRFLMLALALGLVFTGCKDDDNEPGTKSLVEVTPGGDGMPAGTVYYFYAKDADSPEKFNAASNGTFSGEMPFGEYALLGVNTDAAGVIFDGMGDFSTATVSAKVADLPSRTASVGLEPVGDVYVVSVSGLTVKERETTKLTPTPKLLSQTIRLSFDVEEGLVDEIAAIGGEMNGVHSTVNLVTAQPTADAVTNCASTYVVFETETVTRAAGKRQAVLHVLGIQKPDETVLPDYKPHLSLWIEMKDGKYNFLNVPLTDVLTDEDLTDSEIVLPDVEIVRQGAEVKATVGDWETPDASELDPENNTGVKI